MAKPAPMDTDKIKGLVCRECGKEYPAVSLHVCDMCFGPLEVQYNYKAIKPRLTRKAIEAGPKSLWRYVDLLPIAGDPTVGLDAGFTPLVRAKNLGDELGLDKLYIKNDTVNHPTLSFKDRVVSVALTRARELGYDTVACASTGNLANSVAAHAAAAKMQCYVFIPHDLEASKVDGAQAEGCSPIAVAYKLGRDFFKPVKPATIAKSLAIGNPADGYYALKATAESGGAMDTVTDEEIIEGMTLLAQTEGIFAETAGGVTIGVLKKLVKQGLIKRTETTVALITGNGLKTQEAVMNAVGRPTRISPSLVDFQKTFGLGIHER